MIRQDDGTDHRRGGRRPLVEGGADPSSFLLKKQRPGSYVTFVHRKRTKKNPEGSAPPVTSSICRDDHVAVVDGPAGLIGFELGHGSEGKMTSGSLCIVCRC